MKTLTKWLKNQAGYTGDGRYMIARSKHGDVRLYRNVAGQWMDASLSGQELPRGIKLPYFIN